MCVCVCIYNYLDANKTAGEEAKRQLHKNVVSNMFNIVRNILAIYSATCLPSRKLSKLDEPYIQDTAGEAETSS